MTLHPPRKKLDNEGWHVLIRILQLGACLVTPPLYCRRKRSCRFLHQQMDWDNVYNDVPIPLTSQLNGANSPYYVSGIIHPAALEVLGFTGPGELDPETDANPIQKIVENALNASVTNSAFMPLP